MKQLKKILILGAAVLACACNSMLDLEPHASVTPSSVGAGDIEALRIGMYDKMQTNPTLYFYLAFDILGGDLTTSTGRPLDLINAYLNPLHTSISSQWNGLFTALRQVNNLIEVAGGLPESTTRNRALGEAHYFRAWIYLSLVTRFGDVPVLKTNTQDKVSRDPASQAWALVEEDLDAATDCLSGLSAESFYFVSANAVTALKARAKLYLGKNDEAAALAESLIANNNYGLDSFSKIFSENRSTSAANKEVIFAFSCIKSEAASLNLSSQFYSYNHPKAGSYNYRPSAEVMAMYSDGDLRRDDSITTMDNLNFINKYKGGQADTDPIVISRLAEMYLISAEAKGFNGGGLERLNQLRAARGLAAITPSGAAEFTNAILNERRLEFLCEGMRYYDLVRTGKAVEVLGIKDYQCILPLPSRELQYNTNLTQNPGY